MSSAYKLLPHYTYNDYVHWEGKWELIEGIPYAMSPQPRPEHQAVATSLAAELRAAIKKSGCNCKVYQPIDYKISEETVLNPDLLILCRPITKSFLDFPPELVVEILSPATVMKDRHTKFEIYQEQKILYYIIVDIETKKVEVNQLVSDKYQLQTIDQSTPYTFSFSDCSLELVFDNVWD